jgi:hypothetical protein
MSKAGLSVVDRLLERPNRVPADRAKWRAPTAPTHDHVVKRLAAVIAAGIALLAACGDDSSDVDVGAIAACFRDAGYTVTRDPSEFQLQLSAGGQDVTEGVQATSEQNTVVVLVGKSGDAADAIESAARGAVTEPVERSGNAVIVFGSDPSRADKKCVALAK